MIPKPRIEAVENAPPENASINPSAPVFAPAKPANLFWIDTRQNDMCAEAIYENQKQRYKDFAFQFLDAPDIFKCLNKFLHECCDFFIYLPETKKTQFPRVCASYIKLFQNFNCAACCFNC